MIPKLFNLLPEKKYIKNQKKQQWKTIGVADTEKKQIIDSFIDLSSQRIRRNRRVVQNSIQSFQRSLW